MGVQPRTPTAVIFTWVFALVLAVLAVLYRIAPYYWLGPERSELWNLMPVGALTLFVGAQLRTPFALLLPLLVMLVSDLLLIAPLAELGYSAFSRGTPLLYLCFAAYFALGRLLPTDRFSATGTILASLAGGAFFFLITNALAWYANIGTLYEPTFAGLLHSYIAAIPFHRGTLIGDVVFGLMFFGAHALLLLALQRLERQEQLA